jgi:hypothetical protein
MFLQPCQLPRCQSEGNRLTTVDCITELCCRIDAAMTDLPKHPQASLSPSAVVTLAFRFAIKGVGNRPFDRWLARDWTACFPRLPERTRVFRLFTTHRPWAERFVAEPTIVGGIETSGMELIHPMRQGRSPRPIGRKGSSNHRWMVGGKRGLLLNKCGLVGAWDGQTANLDDHTFQPLVRQVAEQMMVFGDPAFHAAVGDLSPLKRWARGEWNDRMLVETVWSRRTVVSHFKKVLHRRWD